MLSRLGQLSRRNVATMATRNPPAQPLLVVLGSTGTGKSQLAVELARRFNGEIINADAMQLYRGLPVITNKITPSEQRGVPHHLLGHISLDQAPWHVHEFKDQATKTIREIRSRGNLPILVGGTQYYVDPILFRHNILDTAQVGSQQSFPILQESTDVLLRELRQLDPVMADRWHPNERRKIRRSLEICLSTGKRASELYAEQDERKAGMVQESLNAAPWENLLFWVYSERDVLCERLDNRVGKMLDAGLLDEIGRLYEIKQSKADCGEAVDSTKGIWQSIGYKQFEPYRAAVDQGHAPGEVEKLKAKALEEMKAATRRYARYQTRWIRLKLVPQLREQGTLAMDSLYVLDSTDADSFAANVVTPAVAVAGQFLAGETRPLPVEVSDLARRVLDTVEHEPTKEVPCNRTCEVCNTTLMTEGAWTRHLKSAGHRRVVRRKKRLAIMPVEQPQPREDDNSSERSGSESGPDIASLFASQ